MTSEARLCALCGGPNDCAMAKSGAASKERCWCVEERFPMDLIERLGVRDRDRRCVCRACLVAHRERSPDG